MHVVKVISGPAAGRSVEFETEVVVGRHEVDLEIEDPQLSRRHAALRVTDAGVVVEDLDSLNGTFVNGARITEPTPITANDKLRLGASELYIERHAEPAILAPVAGAPPTRLTGAPAASLPPTRVTGAEAAAADAAAAVTSTGVSAAADRAAPGPDGGLATEREVSPRRRPTRRKLVVLLPLVAAALVGAGVAIGWYAAPTETVKSGAAARKGSGKPNTQVPPVSAKYVGAGFLSATSSSGALVPAGSAIGDLGGGVSMGVSITGHPFVVLGQVTIQPEAETGWHNHPRGLDGFILVTQGTITMYAANDPRCRPRTLSAGQVAFIGSNLAHDIRNEGATPAKVFALSFFGRPVQPQNAFVPQPRSPACPF